jgi:hypothetical protein
VGVYLLVECFPLHDAWVVRPAPNHGPQLAQVRPRPAHPVVRLILPPLALHEIAVVLHHVLRYHDAEPTRVCWGREGLRERLSWRGCVREGGWKERGGCAHIGTGCTGYISLRSSYHTR